MTDNDTMVSIFKNKLDDELGISKFKRGLEKKINMAKGITYTEEANALAKTKLGAVDTKAAEYYKQLKDYGLSAGEATKEAKKYAKALKNATLREIELMKPGYDKAADIELGKKVALSGIIKDNPIQKRKTTGKKSTGKKSSGKK